MFYLIFLLPIAALILWIHAELRLGRWARITSGVVCLLVAIYLTFSLSRVGPRYERDFHRFALKRAEQCLANGETQRVEEALYRYNTIAATGDTYRAAIDMNGFLSPHKPR